jgi:hypothetical protein
MTPGAQNIKSGPDALAIAENESGSAKHENGTQCLRYSQEQVRERKSRKRDPTQSVPPKTGRGAQNMKTRPDAVSTAENDSVSAKQENETRRCRCRQKRLRERKSRTREPTPSVPPKMGHDALGTAGNEFESAKHENGTRRCWYCRKWVWEHKTRKRDSTPSVPPKMTPGAQNIKSGLDALGTAEIESWSAKHENGTQCLRYSQEQVRERKTRKRDPTQSVPPKTGLGAQNMKTRPDALGTAENASWSA